MRNAKTIFLHINSFGDIVGEAICLPFCGKPQNILFQIFRSGIVGADVPDGPPWGKKTKISAKTPFGIS